MKKEIVEVPGAKRPKRPDGSRVVALSPAVKAGGFVFCSGTYPLDMTTGEIVIGDIQVQTRQCIENLKTVLEAAGTTLDNIVKVTIFCSNSGYFEKVNEIYNEYFAEESPARTFVTVGSWMAAFDIEIECTAIV